MLSFVDFVIVLLFFLLMLYVGIRSSKKINTVKDFVVAGRSLGFGVLLATMVATGMGSGNLFGRSGYAYNAGGAMTVAMVGYTAAMITAAYFTKAMQKHNVITVPELFSAVFGKEGNGKNARLIASFMSFLYSALILGLQFVAFGTLFSFLGSPWGITPTTGAILGAIITIAYTGLGGMFSVAWTDLIQFVVMVTGVIIVGPIVAIKAAGGYGALLANASAAGISTWNPFTGRSAMEIIGLFMVGWTLNAVDPFVWQRIFSAKSFKIARWAIIINGVICFLFCQGLTQMAIAGRVLLPDLVATYGTAEAVLPALITTVFPPVVVGLMISGALATIMSSADSYLLLAGNSLVYDIIAFLKPDLPEEKQIKYLKYSVIAIGAFGLLVGLQMKGMFKMLNFAFSMYGAAIFFPVVAMLYWKKVTAQGVMVSMIVGAAVVIYGYMGGWFPFGFDPQIPALVISVVLLVVVSLLTQPKALPGKVEK
jgi:SSS family solute:Na+ symporter